MQQSDSLFKAVVHAEAVVEVRAGARRDGMEGLAMRGKGAEGKGGQWRIMANNIVVEKIILFGKKRSDIEKN